VRPTELSVDEQLEVLRRGTAEILTEEELRRKIDRSREAGKPLTVKLGLDASAPDIHLGHSVVLRKMRQFQDMGHIGVALIGDFTGRIGDPSGRSEVRRQLSSEEVEANARTYTEQIFKILDPDRTRVEFNSRWLAPMSFAGVVELASKATLARMLERDDFAARFSEQVPIYLHEFFYPLMQGYDSVALDCDVELGGTDQRFNLVMARQIQRDYGHEAEIAVLMPVIEGTDGVRKMSKSLGNYIGIDESPREIFGKTMSIPDQLIGKYARHFTDRDPSEVDRLELLLAEDRINPRDAKADLAEELVRMYHGFEAGKEARNEFNRVFAQGGLPDDIPRVLVTRDALDGGRLWIVEMMRLAGFASSNSEARRLIEQGAVTVDGERVDESDRDIAFDQEVLLRVGKRRVCRLKPE